MRCSAAGTAKSFFLMKVTLINGVNAAVWPRSPEGGSGRERRDALPARSGRARTHSGVRRGGRRADRAAPGDERRRGAAVGAEQAVGATDRPSVDRAGAR